MWRSCLSSIFILDVFLFFSLFSCCFVSFYCRRPHLKLARDSFFPLCLVDSINSARLLPACLPLFASRFCVRAENDSSCSSKQKRRRQVLPKVFPFGIRFTGSLGAMRAVGIRSSEAEAGRRIGFVGIRTEGNIPSSV